MMTITAKINPESIKQAAEIIRSGGLVAFPTETVYGLGANALDPNAVRKIYEAKGRPSDNPLILHVSSCEQAAGLVYMNDTAEKLITRFWPGPLTLVLRAKPVVPSVTRGGLDTAAIRMPDNSVAQALIKASGVPIAAPSANISGRPSPTDFESVFHDMNGRVEMILDGKVECRIGIESTVIDITDPEKILMLRPGGMPRELIEDVLRTRLEIPDNVSKKRSPGTRYKHYAPNIPVIIWHKGEDLANCIRLHLPQSGKRHNMMTNLSESDKQHNLIQAGVTSCAAYMGIHDINDECGRKILFPDVNHYARELFACFRKFEAENFACIVVEWPEGDGGVSEGLRDRIRRAALKD